LSQSRIALAGDPCLKGSWRDFAAEASGLDQKRMQFIADKQNQCYENSCRLDRGWHQAEQAKGREKQQETHECNLRAERQVFLFESSVTH
jgi:hypothetical protein